MHPLWVRRREQGVDASRVVDPAQDHSIRTGGIQHEPQIRRSGLEIGWCDVPARQPDAALVVCDHPGEGRELTQEGHAAEPRIPLEVDVPRPVRLPDDGRVPVPNVW